MSNPIEIMRRFDYVPPSEEKRAQHDELTTAVLGWALELDAMLPEGREKALALTALQECRMWANAAIATTVTP